MEENQVINDVAAGVVEEVSNDLDITKVEPVSNGHAMTTCLGVVGGLFMIGGIVVASKYVVKKIKKAKANKFITLCKKEAEESVQEDLHSHYSDDVDEIVEG